MGGPPPAAQEVEPRSYSPSPVGMNFAGVSWSASEGGVAVDASLPLDNVDAEFEAAQLGYVRTFPLGGRTASAGLLVPFVWGTVSGDVQEESRTVRRQGFGDARFRLAVNLLGGPAQSPREFAERKPSTTVGASLTVVMPSGEYEPSKLINLGSNRWAFKPEIGVYKPLGPLALEMSAGAWLFTDNQDFFGGQRRQQDAMATAQLHASYTFRPGLWVATSANWYGGGSTTIDGDEKDDRQGNTRIGVTLSMPVARGHSLKLGWTDGVTTRIGSDFSTVAIAWQYTWSGGTS